MRDLLTPVSAGKVVVTLPADDTDLWALNGIPLIGLDQLHLRDAQAAPLIAILADIILSTCVQAAAVPTTHASAA